MKCDEVQPLHGPYLDSELDAKTTLEIEQHLKTCPDCARLFAEEEKLQARIIAALNRGQKTAALWEKIERAVAAAAPAPPRPAPSRQVSQPAGWHAVFSALGERLQAGWRRSPRAWTGLAAVWAVILALNFNAPERDTPLVGGQEVPSASEMRLALRQKQLLMAELAATAEPAPADQSEAPPPGPRSDRRNETLNA